MARTMHLLNSLGHVTIHWEQQNDTTVLPVIQNMLDRGFKFFILSDQQEQVPATTIDEMAAARRVIISDEGLQQLQDSGVIQIGGIAIDETDETTGEQAKTAEEVAEHDTVVTQPARGG